MLQQSSVLWPAATLGQIDVALAFGAAIIIEEWDVSFLSLLLRGVRQVSIRRAPEKQSTGGPCVPPHFSLFSRRVLVKLSMLYMDII